MSDTGPLGGPDRRSGQSILPGREVVSLPPDGDARIKIATSPLLAVNPANVPHLARVGPLYDKS